MIVINEKNHSSMIKTISFLSGKGGTGKTSIVANLGIILAQNGLKVLMIDMDFFTRGLTFYVTKGKKSVEWSVISILEGQEDAKPTEIRKGLFLLPPSKQSLDLSPSFEIENLFKEKENHFHYFS